VRPQNPVHALVRYFFLKMDNLIEETYNELIDIVRQKREVLSTKQLIIILQVIEKQIIMETMGHNKNIPINVSISI